MQYSPSFADVPIVKNTPELLRVAELLKMADAFIVFAGAGMSADAGIPVFRGDNGEWTREVELAGRTVSFAELSTHKAFEEHYDLAWEVMLNRINLINRTVPHQGYHWLKEIIGSKDHFIVTSNIDSYFERAGFSEDRVVEIHGSARYFQCMDHHEKEIWLFEEEPDEELIRAPECPNCGGRTRPNIRLFEDWFWLSQRAKYQEKKYVAFLKTIIGKQIAILEIGAGKTLPYIRSAAERNIAMGVSFVRINPEEDANQESIFHIVEGAKSAIGQLHTAICS